MPNHQTHDTIGVVSVIPISLTTVYLGYSMPYVITLGLGVILATYFLSPDLDLYSRIYRRWGIFRWIWLPYQWIIPHRSWLSHSGPISATIRIIYLSLWFLPLLFFFPIPLGNLHFQTFCGMLWLSVVIADSIHVLADVFWKD